MKSSLQNGLATTREIRVDGPRTVALTDQRNGATVRVYAPPALVQDIEIACRALILEHADPGEDSVGTRVAIHHSSDPFPAH